MSSSHSLQLEKSISPTLTNLIAEANFAIESVKEKILNAYNYAVNKEGYDPKDAAKLLREKLTFSQRYIREVLPLEAKDQSKRNLYLNHDAEPVPHTDDDDEESEIEKFRREKALSDRIPDEDDQEERRRIDITTAYDLKDAIIEATDYHPIEQESKELLDDWEKRNLQEIRENQLIDELQEKINKEYSGTYDVDLKDSIIPLKWKFSIKKGMSIEVDIVKAKRMNLH